MMGNMSIDIRLEDMENTFVVYRKVVENIIALGYMDCQSNEFWARFWTFSS